MKPTLIECPTPVPVPGGKQINEYIGAVNSGTEAVSVAIMRSPAGWSEPGQCPDFDEFTVVLKGVLCVEHHEGTLDVRAGQAVISHKGEWVRYSSPRGAEYIAICLPAFTLETAHRDPEQQSASRA